MNKCTILYPNGLFENSALKELVDLNDNVEMVFLPQLNFSASPGALIIVLEFVKTLTFDASYDLMKHIILSLMNKVKLLHKGNTIITVVKDGQKSQINLSFEPTEEQKEKLVDAAIQKLLNG